MHSLRQTALLLQLILRLTWRPLFTRRAGPFTLPALLVAVTITGSFVLLASAVGKFCNTFGLAGVLVVNAAVAHGFFLMVFLGAGELYFANFYRLIRWPVSCRQIAWCSIISIGVDPRILLFVGPLFAVGASLLDKSLAAFLVGVTAQVLSVGAACAAVLAVTGVLQQLRGRYAGTIRGLILATGVTFAIVHLQQTAKFQFGLLANGRTFDLSRVGAGLPLTCLPARAVNAYVKGEPGVACLLFAEAGLVVLLFAEMAAWLGAKSATQN